MAWRPEIATFANEPAPLPHIPQGKRRRTLKVMCATRDKEIAQASSTDFSSGDEAYLGASTEVSDSEQEPFWIEPPRLASPAKSGRDTHTKFFLDDRDRKRRARRPLTTTTEDRPWLTAKSTHPMGMQELPAANVTQLQQDTAHGVVNQGLKEHEDVAISQPLELSNIPPTRARRAKPEAQTTESDWRPRPGKFSDLYRTAKGYFEFFPKWHGDHVRKALINEAKLQPDLGKSRRKKSWKLTPEQIEDQIALWFSSNSADLKRGLAWYHAGKDGLFKSRTGTWVIPQSAMHPNARKIIWDTAEYFAAEPKDRARIQIHPQDFTTERESTWDSAAVLRLAKASRCPDERGVQDICEQGVLVPFDGSMAMVLQPNAVGLFDFLQEATDLSELETTQGLFLEPCMGPSLTPVKISPRNWCTVFRGDAFKSRGTANLTAPFDKVGGACPALLAKHSVNIGYRLDDCTDTEAFPTISYVSSALVAFWCATILPCCPEDFTFSKSDWSKYYRQLRRHPATWWLQGQMTLAAGMSIDTRLIFGPRLGEAHAPVTRAQATQHFSSPRLPLVTCGSKTRQICFVF